MLQDLIKLSDLFFAEKKKCNTELYLVYSF